MNEQEHLQQVLQMLCTWYQQGHRDLPWRQEPTPYHVWVSEIMLQQTRVQAVIPYYKRFLRALPTIPALAEAPEEQLMKLWEGLGYYSRVRNLQRAARMVCDEFGGELPETKQKLLTLCGIGSYTAGAIASIAFGQPCAAVDGNVLRVLSRVFARKWDIKAPAVKKQAEQEIEAALPRADAGDCNQALMELGAMVCLPNGEPLCERCPIAAFCQAREQGIQTQLPIKTPKKQRPVENRVICLLWKDGRLALRKRPAKGLLGGMWEFPNFLLGEDAQTQLEVPLYDIKMLGSTKHIFTHREWHMTGLSASTDEGGYFTWVTLEQLRDIAMPSAFRYYRNIALEMKTTGG